MVQTPTTLGFIGPIGFIGLGVMGGPMCRNVITKHPGTVYVYDMNQQALRAMADLGAIACSSDVDVAKAADITFLSLPGGKEVMHVCGAFAVEARPGTVVVDLSTTAVADARATASMLVAANGILFADAPVARTRQAAIDGTLSIMVGASDAVFARIAPLLAYMGSDVTHCGEVGCGQVVKLVNNTLLFEHVAALAEMMVVAERAGVTPEKLIAAVSLGSGDSFALRNHGLKAMAPRVFPEKAFPSPYVLKDMGYAIDLADQIGVDPKMAQLARSYYQSAVDAGIGEKYFPAIIELIGKD